MRIQDLGGRCTGSLYGDAVPLAQINYRWPKHRADDILRPRVDGPLRLIGMHNRSNSNEVIVPQALNKRTHSVDRPRHGQRDFNAMNAAFA